MKAKRPNGFGKAIERFFREYLPTMRGMSQHTLRSYRDAIVLFLRFVSSRNRRRIEELDLSDVTAERVGQFLSFLEVERHNGVSTRNARLAALHTFARFLAAEQPAHLAELQRILGVPFKRGARNGQIEYLERKEAVTQEHRSFNTIRPARLRAVRTDAQYRCPCSGDPRSSAE